MAATSQLAIPYQTPSDAPNGPTLGQDLAQRVEEILTNGAEDLTVGSLTTPSISTGALTVTGPGSVVTRVRTANQSVTNSTTVVDDNTLVLTPPVNTTWGVDYTLYYNAMPSQDGRLQFSFPTGATLTWGIQAYDIDLKFVSIAFAAAVSGTDFFAVGGNGVTNTMVCRLTATIVMGSNAGNLQLRFAQYVAGSGTSMTMQPRSTMIATRLA